MVKDSTIQDVSSATTHAKDANQLVLIHKPHPTVPNARTTLQILKTAQTAKKVTTRIPQKMLRLTYANLSANLL